MQINKSDANDADGLAQIVRTGWYREVEVKSIESHLVRATLGVRKQLVGMRTEMINQIRGLMKIFGLILPKGSGARFEAGVRARFAEKAELGVVVEPLLAAWRALDDQVAALEQQLVRRARRHEVCHRLMTVPGVGPLTALAFVTTVDDPTRFRRSASVGAYLGLTPRRYQSGVRDVSGRISRCGDRLTRSYLYEAANVLLTRVERWSSLKAWAFRLAKRSGPKKAKVALARKLAALLHRLWRDGTTFSWTTEATA
jgi:transposase